MTSTREEIDKAHQSHEFEKIFQIQPHPTHKNYGDVKMKTIHTKIIIIITETTTTITTHITGTRDQHVKEDIHIVIIVIIIETATTTIKVITKTDNTTIQAIEDAEEEENIYLMKE